MGLFWFIGEFLQKIDFIFFLLVFSKKGFGFIKMLICTSHIIDCNGRRAPEYLFILKFYWKIQVLGLAILKSSMGFLKLRSWESFEFGPSIVMPISLTVSTRPPNWVLKIVLTNSWLKIHLESINVQRIWYITMRRLEEVSYQICPVYRFSAVFATVYSNIGCSDIIAATERNSKKVSAAMNLRLYSTLLTVSFKCHKYYCSCH